MAQKLQRRSQPDASLSGRPRAGGQPPAEHSWSAGRRDPGGQISDPVSRGAHGPGRGGPVGGCQRQQPASIAWHVGGVGAAVEDGLQPVGHVGVVVEAEHGVGLRQRLRELGAVALGQAADGHHRLRPAVDLEIRGGQQGVDAVLLGRLDEPARVHHHRVGVRGVLDELETAQLEPRGQLLGVDVVASAAQRDEMNSRSSHNRTSMPDPSDREGLSAWRPWPVAYGSWTLP